MIIGTEKLLMALVFSMMVSGPLAIADAGAAEYSLTWPTYTDSNNGTFKPANYAIVGMCAVNAGTFTEVGRVTPPVAPIKFTPVAEPGDTVKCFIYAYNTVGKLSSGNTPIVEANVPFVKPTTPGTPSLSSTP